MTDYVFRVPSPKLTDFSRTSTAGDSTTQLDQWLWPVQALFNTPSKKYGMDTADELYLRARAVNWVVRICMTLQLPQLIIATAAAYIHRFYMRKPIQKYSPKVMSATALFLATKVEEVPRKLEYVVREYLKIDEDGNELMGSIPEDSTEFQLLKQQILYFEDILLRTLCFDLAVDHPYVPLVDSVRSIHESHSYSRLPNPTLSVELADRSKAKSITQAAWGFVNDSLLTPLCLVAKPELIAASAFLLAVSDRLSECPPLLDANQPHSNGTFDFDHYLNLPGDEGSSNDQRSEPWWKVFKVESVEEIYPVANTMLDQYESSVCDYIRERAGRLARFPASSLLSSTIQIVRTELSDQMNYDVPSCIMTTDHEKVTYEDTKNGIENKDSDVPTPKMAHQEELRPEDVGNVSDTANSHLPLANASECKENLPHQNVEETSNKVDTMVSSPRQGALATQELEMSSKKNSDVQSPVKLNVAKEEPHYQDVRSHPSNSTPARQAMSDNMDLGTSVDSDNSSSKSASRLEQNRPNQHQSTSSQKTPTIKKRSRSTDNYRGDHPPKTPKLEQTPTTYPEILEHQQSTPTDANLQNPKPDHLLDPSSSVTKLHTDQDIHQANQKFHARGSESSLSDMEDGELD